MTGDTTTDVVGMIPTTRVIVMIDVMTIAVTDGHRQTVMVIAQRPWIDGVKGDEIAPVVSADQDVDSPRGTNKAMTQDPRTETPGVEEDPGVEVDHHSEAIRVPDRLLTTARTKSATNVVCRNTKTSMIAQQSAKTVALV